MTMVTTGSGWVMVGNEAIGYDVVSFLQNRCQTQQYWEATTNKPWCLMMTTN